MTRAQLDKEPAEVAAMFDAVAPRYDLLNDALSLGMDRRWRTADRTSSSSISRQARAPRRGPSRGAARDAWPATSPSAC